MDHIANTANPNTQLNELLSDCSERSRSKNPDLSKAYDELVKRLNSLDRDEIGPAVGDRMPGFALPDSSGNMVRLDRLLQSGPLVISFNRGHWCPYCKLELRSLASHHERIRALGANVVSIMPDSAIFTGDYAAANDLPFPVLSDMDLGYSMSLDLIFWVGTEVQKLYRDVGIALERYQGNDAYFLPMAAKFIVGPDGLVKARRVNIEFRERMEPVELLAILANLRSSAA